MGFASIRRVAVCGISILALGSATGATAQETDDSEIVVTAAKREQSVRDVSGSVSAVSEATLQKLNAQSLSDYITRVPGVVFNDYQPGVSEVVIRGVASSTTRCSARTAATTCGSGACAGRSSSPRPRRRAFRRSACIRNMISTIRPM